MHDKNQDPGITLSEEQKQFVLKYISSMSNSLQRYCVRLLRDIHLSEDAVQEVFLTACVRIEDFFISPKPEAWLMTTAFNVAQNIRRKYVDKQESLLPEDVERIAAPKDTTGMDMEIKFGDAAGTADFGMFTRIFVDGEKMGKVAAENNLSISALKKRVQRLKEKLREELKHD